MIVWFIGGALAVYLLIMPWRLARHAVVSRAVSRKHQPFNHIPKATPAAKRHKQPQHILVVGDSTMYGAGIEDRAYTVGGLFASQYPQATVETIATNGARLRDVPQQLAAAQHRRYDIIMIGIGGNDIVRLTAARTINRQLETIFQAATGTSRQVIICNSVNVGNIGFFYFPLNYLYDWRSRLYSRLCRQAAAGYSSLTFVDLYRPLGDDHYTKQTRASFLSSDGFHANEFANRHFFDIICREAKLG